MRPFLNRMDAGRRLAGRLMQYAGRTDVIVLGLPRGGVPVAAEVARVLNAPLDVFLVRKLGVPGQEELAMGAVAEGGVQVLTQSLIRDLAIPARLVEHAATRERLELERRARAFRGTRPAPDVTARIVVLVDDGLATGATMEAAVRAVRDRQPARIVVAVPVAAAETCDRMARLADEVVAVMLPEPFHAVGLWYEDFAQTTDAEVVQILEAFNPAPAAAAASEQRS